MRSGTGCAKAARRSSGSIDSMHPRSAPRSPPRSTTSTRWRGCRRRPRANSTGSASSGWWPAVLRWMTRAWFPARTAGPARSASGSTSVRRSGASPTPRNSTSATSRRGSARSPRTSHWRSSAARPRPTSASRSTSAGRSCPRPIPVPRVRSRWARRSATCAKAASTRRSPAAARSRCRRSRSVRSTSSEPCPRATTTSRTAPRGRSIWGATASSWARARRCSCWRMPRRPRVAARRHTPSCSATGPRQMPTTWSSRGPTGARRRAPHRSRCRTRTRRPMRSTTSTPTRPRHRSATWPRRARS